MQIWIDADACPRVIKDVLFRASERRKVSLVLVANQPMRHPPLPLVRSVHVGSGFDVADAYIVQEHSAGDLVVTADIPLAAAVIAKGGHALNPRGEFYTTENIHERLSVRNMLDELRGCGMETGGPPAFSPGDKQAFANQLDRFLTRYHKA